MEIQTFSIVIGSRACDAHCKFCVSHMTGFDQVKGLKKNSHDPIGLKKAARLAEISKCTTVLFTGKGEPTLYPGEILSYLDHLASYNFPLIELQTNAIMIGRLAQYYENTNDPSDDTKLNGIPFTKAMLKEFFMKGLDTIAISTVGIKEDWNKETYLWHKNGEGYPHLPTTVKFLREIGFSIRLCVMMRKGAVDSFEKIEHTVDWCLENDVQQLTCRPITSTSGQTSDPDVNEYIKGNGLEEETVRRIYDLVETDPRSTRLMSLMHGAVVYDFKGQNLW